MDGLTAVKEIRAAEQAGTLSRNMVIALTGNARQGQIDHALEAGMDDGESWIRTEVQWRRKVELISFLIQSSSSRTF
jgi:CheY-like chemotaxis protein